MPLVTLDFETYYDKDFSLSKMTTEEYIRDPRFQVIGCAIKVDAQPTVWVPSAGGVALYLTSLNLDWNETAICAHNAMFDAAILRWVFGIKPRRYIDTMTMARAVFGIESSVSLASVATKLGLGAKGTEVQNALGKRLEHFTHAELSAYGEYCRNDVELCFQIAQHLLPQLPITERIAMSWTIEQFADPVLRLNTEKLKKELHKFTVELEEARSTLGVTVSALRSDDAFAILLMSEGVTPPTKVSETTGQERWAFSKSDIEFMDLLESDNPRVVALVEARLGNKTSIATSRLTRLIGISERGPMPVPLQYAGAVTTKRWSGTDKINLQNLPKKGVFREAIEPPPGYYMVAGDLSQIELRVNAWQSEQHDMLEVMRNGGDPYAVMATSIYGYTVKKDTHPVERFAGKTAVLGCGYGCGATKFQHMLKVAAKRERITLPDDSREFAEFVVSGYRRANSRIAGFWRMADSAIRLLASGQRGSLGPYNIEDGKLFLPNGQYLYYPNLRRTEEGEWLYDRRRFRSMVTTKLYGAKLVENVTQAASRLFVSDAICKLTTNSTHIRPVFTVHDELVVIVPDHVPTDEAVSMVNDALTRPSPAMGEFFKGLPLKADVHAGPNYGAIK